MLPSYPKTVTIVEVGPRDGLQNEPQTIALADKLAFIGKLVASGLKQIEITSFVHPQRVPQLADAMEVAMGVTPFEGVTYSALVPNMKGLERAISAGIKRVAVFTAASDMFTQKNINMTISESLTTFQSLVAKALAENLSVRGYVSTAFVCPYAGDIAPKQVLSVTQALLDMGIDEVSLGDTIGAAAPTDMYHTVGYLLEHDVSARCLALHCHNTYGTALANVVAGLDLGITTFDASVAGLGGCPYAPGASGNLATEDLVYLLHRMGIQTGLDLSRLLEASRLMQQVLGRPLHSKLLLPT
jgi:hydroxymethylglutaryl-CoA lyase